MNTSSKPDGTLQESPKQNRYLVYAILGDPTSITKEVLDSTCSGLEIVAFDELRIAVRALPHNQPGNDADASRLQEFSDILCELHRLGDILPFRFGTIVDADELPKFFGPQKEALLRSLEQIAGCVEINLRWAVPEEKLFSIPSSKAQIADEPKSGASYLQGKWKSKQRELHVESLLSSTGACIQELVGEGCVAMKTSIRTMRTVCTERDRENVYSIARLDLLIRRSAFHQAMQTVATIPFCNVRPTLMSGPWPPFSFVGGLGMTTKEDANIKQEQSPLIRLEAQA